MRLLKRLRAILYLGFHLSLNIVERGFGKRRGLKEFLQDYGGDLILPYTREEKQLLPWFSRCIQCGLCDSLCPQYASAPQDLGPALLPFLSRSIPNFAPLSFTLERCTTCQGCESICPTGVPLKRLIQFIREKQELSNRWKRSGPR